jgi:hypothetical protein
MKDQNGPSPAVNPLDQTANHYMEGGGKSKQSRKLAGIEESVKTLK